MTTRRITSPVVDVMAWLNRELGKHVTETGGSMRQELARVMKKHPSTLSTWSSGLRPMPERAIFEVLAGVRQLGLPLFGELLARMRAAAPHLDYTLFEQPVQEVGQAQPERASQGDIDMIVARAAERLSIVLLRVVE
jgi:hypothetical protein